ncbi:MAG: type I-C CRISPR-associated protein Cas7/Csd2 [Coriobacteriia bacterium]
MENAMINDPTRRHDFVFLFDVTDGNPNGDPDAGNMPRLDPETNQGLVTDVCLKRKVRNYVALTRANEEDKKVYVQDGGVALNTLHADAYAAKGLKSTGSKQARSDINVAREHMCANYYDVRMFGAVMTTGVNCGQVRGPVQLTFARSVDAVFPMDISITRVAITKPEDAEVVVSEDGKSGKGKTTEMGRKYIVPYGLYVGHGFFSAPLAAQTGVTSDDLALFWDSLQGMWDLDRSASRGMMALRGLYIFTHDNGLGSAPAQDLFDRVSVSRVSEENSPRQFSDYRTAISSDDLPSGVTLTTVVG